MGQDIETIEGLIDVQRLGWMFDQWMKTKFHTISASGDKIIVIDKDGNRTETNDLAAAAKAAKAEWDVTYKPQITSATSNANTATSNANTATTNANTAAQGATNVNAMLGNTGGIVTITVTDRAGNSVTKEVGFRFAKVYPSYAAMQADFSGTDVNQGQFVLISSNVEDPHNAEFYVKNANAWGFMGDLSGAQGIKGDTPVLTALEDGTIYSDGTLLTDIIKTTNATVVSQENTRQQNETTRQSNETARQTAEGQRASTFTTNEAQRQSDFEAAQTSRDTTWTNWFSDSLSTGVRKLWNDFWSSVNNSWDSFFGTSAEDANGVRKIWSTWYSATQTAWTTWFGTSSSEGVQKDWADLASDAAADHTRAGQDHTRADSDHSTAASDHTTAGTDHTTAASDHTQALSDTNRAADDHTRAETDHSTAVSDSARADTDHTQATSDSTRAGNDHTTASSDHTRAESDHARAETDSTRAYNDHTRAESEHTTAVSDHSAASSDHATASTDHATALEDHSIATTDHDTASTDHETAEDDHGIAVTDHNVAVSDHTTASSDHTTASSDHSTAVSDHTRAEGDHTVADSDHSTAEADHTRAEGDHTTATTDHTQADTDHTAAVTATQYANEQGDYAKDWNDHPPFIGNGTTGDLNYWYLWNIITEQYVRSAYAKGDNLNWDDMTPAEKQRLIDEVLQSLEDFGFDAVPTEGSTRPVRSGGIYNAIQDEATARSNADTTLQGNITAETTRAQGAEQANANAISTINGKIPSEATTSNQLADKSWVTTIVGAEATRAEGAEQTLQGNIEAEATARTSADTTLQTNIDNEATARQGADTTLQNNIDAEETRAKAAEKANADDIDAIEALIPSAATTSNQLADKAFVNSSIATATATFRGTYNLVSDLNLSVSATQAQIATALGTTISTADNNDYCFVQIPTADSTPTEIARVDRYKYNGTAWVLEYSLNNSGFTAQQWEAINSTITSVLVAKLTALPTNAELTALLDAKQDNLTFASDETCESIIDELT